jgi:hypothetical protein
MYTIQCWTPIYLAALVFTSGNISALLMMSRSSRGFETASRRLILAQNGTLIGVLFLYFASTLPMSIITNNRANNLIDDALTLMERLEAAGIASRAEMPVDTILKAPIGEILSQAQALQDREKGLNVWIDGLLAIAIFFCFFFACAAIASLRFVLRLRQGKLPQINFCSQLMDSLQNLRRQCRPERLALRDRWHFALSTSHENKPSPSSTTPTTSV